MIPRAEPSPSHGARSAASVGSAAAAESLWGGMLVFLCRLHIMLGWFRAAFESIWDVEWEEASNFKRSDGGRSSGVYFVQLPGDRVVVVKPDDEVVADYCGFVLALYFDVHHPDMRVVRLDSAEGKRITGALTRLDAAKPRKQRAKPPIATTLAAVPSVLVMNLVRGRSLKGVALAGYMDRTEADKFCETMLGPPGALSDAGRARMRRDAVCICGMCRTDTCVNYYSLAS